MKYLLSLLFILMLGLSAEAQVTFKPTIGINSTNVSKDPATGEAKGRIGWQFGASFMFGKKFFVEPGLFYLQKSTEFSSKTTPDLNFTKKISGFRVPVGVGFRLLGNDDTFAALRVLGGGSGYFVTSVSGGDLEKEDIQSPTWGVFAGAGLDIWILFLDLKYEWSLTDISGITEFDVGQQRSFFTNAGIRINF